MGKTIELKDGAAAERAHHGLFSGPEILEKIILFALTVVPGALMGLSDIVLKSLRFYGLHSEPSSDFLRDFPGFSNFIFFVALLTYPLIGWTLYRLLTMKSENKNDYYFPFLLYAGFYIFGSFSLIFSPLPFMAAGAYILSAAGGILLSIKLYKTNKLTFATHTLLLPFVLIMAAVPFLF